MSLATSSHAGTRTRDTVPGPVKRVRPAVPARRLHDKPGERPSALLWSSLGPQQYVKAFKASGQDLVDAVNAGAPTAFVHTLADHMHIPRHHLMARLGFASSTIRRRAASQAQLTKEESSRVLGLARIIGQVQSMVEESGGAEDFDAAPWVAQWMETPIPALGGRRPSEYMDTAEGQSVVSRLLSQARSGAFA